MIDSEQHIREAAYYLWKKWHQFFPTFTDKHFWWWAELENSKEHKVTWYRDGITVTSGKAFVWYDNYGHIRAMLDNKDILKGTL
jgi:hypothetical protein